MNMIRLMILNVLLLELLFPPCTVQAIEQNILKCEITASNGLMFTFRFWTQAPYTLTQMFPDANQIFS